MLRSGRTPAASGFRTQYFYYGESSALVSWQGLEARLSGLVFEDGSDVESVWVKLSDYTIYGYESLNKAMDMLWDNDCITVFVTYKDGMKINTAEKAEYKDGVRAEAKFTLVNGNELLSAGKDNAVYVQTLPIHPLLDSVCHNGHNAGRYRPNGSYLSL